MAVRALSMPDRIGQAGLMAGFAGKPGMFVLQWKSSSGMIEIAFFLDSIKGLRGMAFCAVLSELTVVRIAMAVETGLILQACELLEFSALLYGQLVTFDTGNILVSSC